MHPENRVTCVGNLVLPALMNDSYTSSTITVSLPEHHKGEVHSLHISQTLIYFSISLLYNLSTHYCSTALMLASAPGALIMSSTCIICSSAESYND